MSARLFFYDTETTGLPDFGQPSEAEHQPHLVQVAASLVDEESRRTIAALELIIAPTDWVIPDDVAAIHGITTDYAARHGVSEALAMQAVTALWAQADRRIAHNESFDARILRIAIKRFADEALADKWKAGAAECTARLATPHCALPPTERMKAAKRFHHKTPNLGEAFQFFMGRPLENAHSARADVDACRDIYFAMRDRQPVAA